MTFYQMLQCNVKTLKQFIDTSKTIQEKRKYTFALVIKDILCVAFCFLFVSLFSMIFHPTNSVAGVMILLAILSIRFVDFHYNIHQNYLSLFIIFLIEAISPHFSYMFPLPISFLIHCLSLLTIIILSCYKVDYAHHYTFVLGYILLWGNDVQGTDYILRCLGLMFGACLIIAIVFHQHRHKQHDKTLVNVVQEFFQNNQRTKWQLQLCTLIALTMSIGTFLGYPKTMWICFACLSLTSFDKDQHHFKSLRRAPYVVVGCVIFTLMMFVLPKQYLPYVGIIGGLCVGVSASYGWQTAFNCFGALSVTIGLFGIQGAIILRIVSNVIGTIMTYLYDHIFHWIYNSILVLRKCFIKQLS